MKPPQKTYALIFTAAAFVIIFIRFSINIAGISEPGRFGKFTSRFLKDTVQVFKNNYAIPHITAKNESDVYFMLGYCHAENRLWQMDLYRRLASGEISEIFGLETLNSDKFFKALSFNAISKDILSKTDKATLSLLESYSNGINKYIQSHIKKLPFEFGALNYLPKEWEPLDCIKIQRLTAFENCRAFNTDLILGEIAEKIGIEETASLLPAYPPDAPCILDDTIIRHARNKGIADSSKLSFYRCSIQFSILIGAVQSGIENIRRNTGLSSGFGSNIWALKLNQPDINQKGAIFSADPHSSLNLPSRWYQVHLTCPEFNAVGMTMPGIPFIFFGRNDNISWGMASMLIDDCDFFIEKVDSSNNNFYYSRDFKRVKFKFIPDTIKIHNSEPYIHYIRYTERSAVFSDFLPFDFDAVFSEDKEKNNDSLYFSKYCLTYSWTASESSHELTSLCRIMKSSSWEQFKAATNTWKSPAVIFCYADKNGNIGLNPAGSIPERNPSCLSWLPNPGWLNEYSWKGINRNFNFDNLYNPRKGYVFAANNKLSGNKSQYIPYYWELPSRAERIDSLLRSAELYNTRNSQLMQIDLFSQFAKELLDITIPVLKNNYPSMGEIQKKSLETLISWDYFLSPLTEQPSIYAAFLNKLLYNVFSLKIPDKYLLDKYLSLTGIASGKLSELIAAKNPAPGDSLQARNSFLPDKNNVILKSFNEAVESLHEYFDSDDLTQWRYGSLHTVTISHYISYYNLVGSAVNFGPYRIGGDNSTINNSAWDFNMPYTLKTGASMRFVCNMAEQQVYCVIPGGASGEPLGDNYGDQVQIWLNGGYVKLDTSPVPTEDFHLAISAFPER